MRLPSLESGHRLKEKLLLRMMGLMMGRTPPDVVKTLLYRRDFWGDPYNELLQPVMNVPAVRPEQRETLETAPQDGEHHVHNRERQRKQRGDQCRDDRECAFCLCIHFIFPFSKLNLYIASLSTQHPKQFDETLERSSTPKWPRDPGVR